MARINVPGLKASSGMKEFAPLADGEYIVKCVKCEVRPPKDPAPLDVWNFEFVIMDGPVQPDGKPAKGRKAWHNINVLKSEHPSYKQEWDDPKSGQCQMAVDELKSMVVAGGIEIKKDDLNSDSFSGVEFATKMVTTVSKNNGKTYHNFRGWASA